MSDDATTTLTLSYSLILDVYRFWRQSLRHTALGGGGLIMLGICQFSIADVYMCPKHV